MRKIKAVIFDLDGTICNTLEDLGECTNRALADFNLPPTPIEDYRMIVGNGVDTQMKRAIGEEKYTKELGDKVKEHFKRYYAQDYLKHTKPYEGMEEALDCLHEMGLMTAVFSNKPDEFAGKLCRELFGERFSMVVGNRPNVPVKPDPSGLQPILKELGLKAEECVYCGDSCVDIDTGKNAGMKTIGAAWGFRGRKELEERGADAVTEQPNELPVLLKQWEE